MSRKASPEAAREPGLGARTLVGIAAFVFAAYAYAVGSGAFGPEFCSFYKWNHNFVLRDVVDAYLHFEGVWYRPSAFHTPYWLLQKALSWHNVAGWKLLQAVTLVAAAWSIGWVTVLLFPARRLAAVLASAFFAVLPGCYSILLQNSAFDFLHVASCAATVGMYIRARRAVRPLRWLLAAVACYAFALTTKEIAVVTPLYLAAIGAIEVWHGKARVVRELRLLAPFFAVMAAYWALHIQRMPVHPAEGAYRTETNIRLIEENLVKYPLWMVRIYGGTGDTLGQTHGHDNQWNTYTALLLFAIVSSQWARDLRRHRELLPGFLLALAWIAVFAIVPVYSGGFLWHINLAAAGYAMLFGVAVSRLIGSTSRPVLGAGIGLALLLVMGWKSTADTLERGVHALQYRISRAALANPLPVAETRIPPNALLFYEDRYGLGNWAYGGGDNLFKWRYLRPDLQEKSVPPIARVPGDLIARWLAAPHAFFFTHDDNFRWNDVTGIFRKQALDSLPGYTNELLTQNRNQEVFDLLDLVRKRADAPLSTLHYYHHAVAAHRLKHYDQALESFARAIEREPDYMLAYLNRGYTWEALNRTLEACRDYRKALELEPGQEGVRALTAKACR